MRIFSALIITLVLACTGCEVRFNTDPRQGESEGVSYGDAEEQARFKQALTAAGIPYEVTVERNKEFINWDISYSKAVERVKDSLFVPSGRNISLDEQGQARFKVWLEQRKIPYRTMIADKREYIVWEEADSQRVKEWEELHPYHDDTVYSPGQ